MKKLIVILALMAFASVVTYADYPIVGYRYLADPGAIYYNGRLYVYCSNDDENVTENYLMSSIVCVSTSDLKNWTDHGIVFDVPRDAKWSNLSWAPSPAYKNGKFYLYFGNGGSAIGVGVADNPLGPFVDPVKGSIASGSTPGVQPFDGWLFDPMTFIDDDGQAYMYFGGNGEGNLRVVKLNSDMVSVNGSAGKFNVPYFFEASWLHKHNGLYYFTYSTNPSNGMRIDYMTSTNPMSGFTYRGVLSNQPPTNNNNNHQAIVKVGEQWYQVYHNRIVASQNNEPMAYRRNLAIDAFSHNADGTITKMVNTVDGVKQLKYLDPYVRVEAETMSNHNGIETEVCSAGGMDLAYIDNGDWIMVEGVDFGSTGPGSFTASVASDKTGGTIEIRTGSSTGALIGTVQVPNTGGFQAWKSVTINVSSVTGVKNVYFAFKGSSASLFNFDYWKFAITGPSVSLTEPQANAKFIAPATVNFAASASTTTGTITKVEFFNGNTRIGEDATTPYTFAWTDVAAGTYTITAVATNNLSQTAKSEELIVKVGVPQGPYNGTAWPIPGKIEFEHFDVGGSGLAYIDSAATNTGGATFRTDEDVDIENCTDTLGKGYNIGWTTNGEWLEYTVNVATAGKYDLTLRTACNGDGRTLSVSIKDLVVAKDVAIPNTAGWQAWQDVVVKDIQLDAGIQVVKVTIGATNYVNLNYMVFSSQSAPKPGIALKAGWNIIGYPFETSTDLATALSSIWANIQTVKDLTSFYDKSQPAAFNSLTKVEWGKGYMVKVTKDCELKWNEK